MATINYQYMRPKKAATWKAWQEEPIEVREELTTWSGKNATILPVRKARYDLFYAGTGGVVDAEGNNVQISATLPTVSAGHSFDKAEYCDQKVVYCGYMIKHWGHYLMEGVSRLWYFLENDPTIDRYIFAMDENEEREVKGNYRVFLELLGIWDKITFINKPTTYREVVVPELAFRNHEYLSPKFTAIYESAAANIRLDPSWKKYDKIFLSRSNFNHTNPLEFGQEVIDNFFHVNDYKILYPETLSLDQLIFYIRNAQIVASISGTPPHHMMFAHDGQQLIILERSAMNNPYQVCVDQLRKLHVTYIDASLPIYPVRMQGPHLMGYTRQLQAFAEDHGNMRPPESQYRSEKYLKKCFVQYMKCYTDIYRHQWFVGNDVVETMDYLYEGYQDSMAYFGDYMNGSKPFLWYHYLQFHYWKQIIKRIIKALRK